MKQLWNALVNEPVLLFTILSAGLVAANEAVDVAWLGLTTVVVVAVTGVLTRHFTTPTRKL